MLQYLETITRWQKEGRRIVLARVIKTWGSSPRPIGSVMLISDNGQIAGSVSGGCVEGDVVKKAQELFEHGKSVQVSYGVTNEEAWTVGLSCGGQLEVFLQELDSSSVWNELHKQLSNNRFGVLISSIDKPYKNALLTSEGLVGDDIPQEIREQASSALVARHHTMVSHEETRYFIHLFPRKSTLLIIGVAHITVELIKLAKWHDFEVVVIDPRAFFSKNTVFDVLPDRIIEKYPSEALEDLPLDSYTYAAILSHDPKIDDNALEVLLNHNIAYIGALGSKKNHAKRIDRLKEKGFSTDQIASVHAPIGVSIGAQGAQEIALSIMAEVIAFKNQ